MHRDRILRSGLFRPSDEAPSWQPLLDMYELQDGWLLKADLARVRPDEGVRRAPGPRAESSRRT